VRNIFLFIRRYFNLLFFLLLQGFSIYLIVHYSRYHNASFSNVANQLTGKVNQQYSKVEYYFNLKRTNDSLIKANERLYNKLRTDFALPDSSSKIVIDSIRIDSLEQYRRYQFFPAKVVYNSVASQNNFIVLGRGSAQQLKKDMGVVDINNGVIGVITEVSKDYAVVMSLLHKDSHINGKLLKGGETGTLSWDGKIPNIITLNGVPKGSKVAPGDTIISSGLSSTSLPKGMMLGIVTEVIPDKATSFFIVKFRSAANFYNLEYAFAIDNKQAGDINDILKKAEKKTP
jgi:rod shape-determining protein MreC